MAFQYQFSITGILSRQVPQLGLWPILRLEVWVILKDFLFRSALGQHVQHVLHPEAHAAEAGPPAAMDGQNEKN